MKNFLMFAAGIGILIISSSIAYYFVILMPQQHAQTQKELSDIRRAIAPTQPEMEQQLASWATEMGNQAQNTRSNR